MKEIKIRFAPNGDYTVETSGYSGPECERATREIEEALGTRTGNRRTAEYNAPQQQAIKR